MNNKSAIRAILTISSVFISIEKATAISLKNEDEKSPCHTVSQCLEAGFELKTTSSLRFETPNGDSRVLVSHYLVRGPVVVHCWSTWYPFAIPKEWTNMDWGGCMLNEP